VPLLSPTFMSRHSGRSLAERFCSCKQCLTITGNLPGLLKSIIPHRSFTLCGQG
jgi:hypothetical protein